MSQSLEGATVTTTHGINHPTHDEEATALNQVTNDIHITVITYTIIIIMALFYYAYRKMLRVIMRQLKCLNVQGIIQMISVKECLTIIQQLKIM